MKKTAADKKIISYSHKESSVSGDAFFEIRESKGPVAQRKVNFFVPHRKDYYLLVFVRKGNSRHWIDLTPYTLKPDTFYFSVPQQVHLKEKSTPLDGILLSFTEEFLQLETNRALKELPVIKNTYNEHELKLSKKDVAFIEELLLKMLDEYAASADWKNGMLQSYLNVLLIYTSRLYTQQFQKLNASPDRQLLNRFKSLIEAHYTSSHLVVQYAGLLHLTPGHLNDVVKKQSGKTAIAHIHERIVMEAKRRLFHTSLSAKEIAYELGFEDAAYFNRFFKKHTNTTPSAFRSSALKKYN